MILALLFEVFLQGVEHHGSVYSIIPQWWHLTVLQYVAASFHLPSVSTANINTVQYPKPHQQYEIPTIPAVVISNVLLPQSNIMAAFVHSHSSLLCDVSPVLPTYDNHNVTQYTALFTTVSPCWPPQSPAQNVSLPTFCSTLQSLNASPEGCEYQKEENFIIFATVVHWNWELKYLRCI